MKKLALSAVIILGSLSMNAENAENAEKALESKIIWNLGNVQDGYKEIAVTAIPLEVKATLEKSFPNSKLEKAFVNSKKQYKLQLITKEGESKHFVFTDAKGVIAEKF